MTLPDFLTKDEDGFIRLTGHRIGLEHVVALYNEGYSPEMLFCQFPTLSLALIHKTIAFYLENQAEVDRDITESRAEIERQRAAAPKGTGLAELRHRLEAMSRVI